MGDEQLRGRALAESVGQEWSRETCAMYRGLVHCPHAHTSYCPCDSWTETTRDMTARLKRERDEAVARAEQEKAEKDAWAWAAAMAFTVDARCERCPVSNPADGISVSAVSCDERRPVPSCALVLYEYARQLLRPPVSLAGREE